MTDFFQFLLGGLISSGVLLAAAIFVFKLSFEKLLDKQVEAFKAQLSRDIEFLKNDLAKDLEQVKSAFARDLEVIRSELRIDEAAKDARFRSLLEFRGRQLSDFYWPLYLALQKDNAIWRRILDKRDATDELRKKVGTVIERDIVMPNHERMVALIESNLHLAEADERLENDLLQFIRYVSVNQSIHIIGDNDAYPAKLGEKWPRHLYPKIEQRTKALQAEYDLLVKRRVADARAPLNGTV